jgi:predicted AlkP superfamily phosphohydrolase/phosphomutase
VGNLTVTIAKRALFIGWDGADWNLIHPQVDAGKMPNLEKVINSGVIGNLATLYPSLSPMLWTSIATGKRAFKHGICGFTEPDPQTGGVRPITSISRKTKAIWNILCQQGKRCLVLGWWPSHPAEPINGVMVSNHFSGRYAPLEKSWPLIPGTVHPSQLAEPLATLRWHPQKLDAGHILPFVPEAARIDQDKDRRIETLARIICDACTIQDAALALLQCEPWDFASVYFDAIDHFSHAFMRYHPPRLEWMPEEDYETYRQVVEGGYILHDIILGKLLAGLDDETVIILASDHGFHTDHLRPRHIPREPAGPAAQHRHYGIFAMMGPHVKRDERIYGASLLDIGPTILTLFGLPVGADMDGKPLLDAFEAPPTVTSIPSWDEVPGDSGMHPPDLRIDPILAREAIHQLVALGYIEKPRMIRSEPWQKPRVSWTTILRALISTPVYICTPPPSWNAWGRNGQEKAASASNWPRAMKPLGVSGRLGKWPRRS